MRLRRGLIACLAVASAACLLPVAASVAQDPVPDPPDPGSSAPPEPDTEPAEPPAGGEPVPVDDPSPVADAAETPAEEPSPVVEIPAPIESESPLLGEPAPERRAEQTVSAPTRGERARRASLARAFDEPDAICADSHKPETCALALAGLSQACATQPDPAACEQSVRVHACAVTPLSTACLAYLTTRPCVTSGTQSFECRFWSGLRTIYCSKVLRDPDCLPPVCCFAEPVGPDDPKLGSGTLTSGPGGPPDALGIPDPGGLGDRGAGAAADRDRERLPFTGLGMTGMLMFGLGTLLAGIGIRRRCGSSCRAAGVGPGPAVAAGSRRLNHSRAAPVEILCDRDWLG